METTTGSKASRPSHDANDIPGTNSFRSVDELTEINLIKSTDATKEKNVIKSRTMSNDASMKLKIQRASFEASQSSSSGIMMSIANSNVDGAVAGASDNQAATRCVNTSVGSNSSANSTESSFAGFEMNVFATEIDLTFSLDYRYITDVSIFDFFSNVWF